MDFKRILRGPILWIILGVAVVAVAFSLIGGSNFKEITTKQGLTLLKDNKVASAKIVDSEQRVDLVLTTAGTDGKDVQFYYAAPRGSEIVKAVTDANPKSFDDEVDKSNWFPSLLGLIVPFLIIGV